MRPPPPDHPIQDKTGKIDRVWYRYLTDTNYRDSATYLHANTDGAGGWDDLRAPATAINPTGIVGAPTYDTTNVGYKFETGLQQRIDVIFQLPHGWDRTNIHPHIHWKPYTNATGNVLWNLQYSWTNNLGIQPAFTGSNVNATVNVVGGAILREHIVTLGNIVPNTNQKESSIIKFIITRVGTDPRDTYTHDILFDEFDIHYYNAKAGTDPEYPV